MATRIAFTGGESILVAEELDAVVKALEAHGTASSVMPQFARKAGYSDPGTIEGQPVFVRPSAILYVTNV